MVRAKSPDSLQRSLEKMVSEQSSLHYINSPGHAFALSGTLHGHTKALQRTETDDPLLFAYECMEHIPMMLGILLGMYKWSKAVIESTPDQIQETGVH